MRICIYYFYYLCYINESKYTSNYENSFKSLTFTQQFLYQVPFYIPCLPKSKKYFWANKRTRRKTQPRRRNQVRISRGNAAAKDSIYIISIKSHFSAFAINKLTQKCKFLYMLIYHTCIKFYFIVMECPLYSLENTNNNSYYILLLVSWHRTM